MLLLLLSALPMVSTPAGPHEASSAWCGTCHVEHFKQWRASRHGQAATNSLYVANHSQWPLKWCDECHLTLGREDEGVGCATCHLDQGVLLSTRPPTTAGQAAHRERQDQALAGVAACERCHQFNFPSLSEPVRYSDKPMQNTVAEWRAWGGGRPCQSCHLRAGNHSMTGAHDEDRLRRALEASVTRVDADTVELKLEGRRAGHRIPTGDVFRTLRLEVFDETGVMVANQEFGHLGRTGDDTLPPPPLDGGVSQRSFRVNAPGATRFRLLFTFVGPKTAPLVPADAELEYLSGTFEDPDKENAP
jgi:hypothetical protein